MNYSLNYQISCEFDGKNDWCKRMRNWVLVKKEQTNDPLAFFIHSSREFLAVLQKGIIFFRCLQWYITNGGLCINGV